MSLLSVLRNKSLFRIGKYYTMPAPIVGRRFGVGDITPPDREKIKGTKVAGISGSSRQQAGMSKSERLLMKALARYEELGCETTFLRLKDLKIYD
jgi:hypothetical protein